MYFLQLYSETLPAGAKNDPQLWAQHNIIYVDKGELEIHGCWIRAQNSTYIEEYAHVKAGEKGATIWRWAIASEHRPLTFLQGTGIESVLVLSRQVRMFELMPTSVWLFRLDCIVDHEESTGLHSHPGSGIRCLISGNIRVVSEKGECSHNTKHGDAWYEEGAYPCVSTTEPNVKSTFLRGMILPPEYAHRPDTIHKLEDVTVKGSWKRFEQRIVQLR